MNKFFQQFTTPHQKPTPATGTDAVSSEIEKIVVVTRQTALEGLVMRMNTKAQARFVLEQNQVSFTEYERADSQYHQSVEAIRKKLPDGVKWQWIDRDLLPTFQFGAKDLVVTVGPDGLVVNVAKYLTTQPIVAVNPDPARIDGVLIPFSVEDVGDALKQAVAGALPIRRVSMVKATLNDGQTLYGVNDLFIGARSHVSARYQLDIGSMGEPQSSSGIIVSTGVGCTGWLRSITRGAWHVARYLGYTNEPPPTPEQIQLGWESEQLWYNVREPFISATSEANLVFGQLDAGQEMVVTSKMPDYGVIFSDGIEADYLTFNSGAIARIGVAERKAHLVVRG